MGLPPAGAPGPRRRCRWSVRRSRRARQREAPPRARKACADPSTRCDGRPALDRTGPVLRCRCAV